MPFIPAASGTKGLPGPSGRGGHHGVAWLAQGEPPLVAHGTSSKLRSYCYPSERLGLARCKMSYQPCLHRAERPATGDGHATLCLTVGPSGPPKGNLASACEPC